MQRTANLITALTALALAVAFVAGLSFQTQRTDAAAATIAALNVGTCYTTDLSVLDRDDCNDHRNSFEYNQQGLNQAVEVDTLYATYAFDPKGGGAGDSPRAILEDSDLIKISITDEDRDVREGVLMMRKADLELSPVSPVENNPEDGSDRLELRTAVRDDELPMVGAGTPTPTPNPDPDEPRDHFGAVVADAVDGYSYDGPGSDTEMDTVPELEQDFSFRLREGDDADERNAVEISEPGIVEIVLDGMNFKPIAEGENRGEMLFFGTVNNADDDLNIGFGELGDFLIWDEDVNPGTTLGAPSVSVTADPRVDDTIVLRAIYYLTSDIEYMLGGETCLPLSGSVNDPTTSANEAPAMDDPDTTEDDKYFKTNQAACASEELGEDFGDYDRFVLSASAEGEVRDMNLYLEETDRFSGVFQGYVRLTDVNGDGGRWNGVTRQVDSDRDNWGRKVKDATREATETLRSDGVSMPESGAVVPVGGTVVITYKDTDGETRKFEVMVDEVPPYVFVDNPVPDGSGNDPRSDDERIDFVGRIGDDRSGLAEDTFALYVDHTDDDANSDKVLNLNVTESATEADTLQHEKLGKVVANPAESEVAVAQDYSGYHDDHPTYAVVEAGRIYIEVGSEADVDVKGVDADYNDADSDATFSDSVRITFLDDDELYNHAIDFQALVRDRAGNIGFSDSDDAAPRLINDLGTKWDDRLGRPGNDPLPNVLGVFSSHVVYLDNVDPFLPEKQSITGYYGLDSDKKPIADRSSVMVVFDGPIDSRSVNEGTFTLWLNPDEEDENHEGSQILSIVDTEVSGKLVFLKLADELESDATPWLRIATGEEVRDLAGRVTRHDEALDGDSQDQKRIVQVQDGILPVFTVTLSEGSGTGVGAYGPTELTKEKIKVEVSSDERIQGAPSIAVVCSNLSYRLNDEDEDSDVDFYVDSLSGQFEERQTGVIDQDDLQDAMSCGIEVSNFVIRAATPLGTRVRTVWQLTWNQLPVGNPSWVPDGLATVVVWGQDRSDYNSYEDGNGRENYGSESAEFRLDSEFTSPLAGQGGRVLPAAGDKVAERRPFVSLEFDHEWSPVDVTELTVDGNDVLDELDARGDNKFLYWPEALGSGEHEVVFSAKDAADNKIEDESFKFEVDTREPFILSLFAGWNAISFPAPPVINTLDAIFGESPVDRVIGWNPASGTGPWAVATKTDGVWTTSLETAPLTELRSQYGYWVHATAFSDLSVELQGPLDRETGSVPELIGVPTYPGWNFVGVVDQDGDQSEGRAGGDLLDGIENAAGEQGVKDQQDPIEVKDYLEGFAQAYRWDVITHSYRVLKGSDKVRIGEGIWVYFDGGIAP